MKLLIKYISSLRILHKDRKLSLQNQVDSSPLIDITISKLSQKLSQLEHISIPDLKNNVDKLSKSVLEMKKDLSDKERTEGHVLNAIDKVPIVVSQNVIKKRLIYFNYK